MNQSQRNFLINKIKENIKVRVGALEGAKPEYPNMANYLFHAVMNNTLKIQPQEKILEVVRQKALKAKSGSNWLEDNRSWGSLERVVKFQISEIFILPDDYNKMLEDYMVRIADINVKIADIRIAGDSLITRIQLASDKTLQTMINEVDDMGDISLMDDKLKLLSGAGTKQISGGAGG